MSAKYHSQLDDYLKSVLLRRRRSVGEYQDYRDYPEQGERLLSQRFLKPLRRLHVVLFSTVQAGGAEQACWADHDLLHAVLHAAGAAGLLLRPVVSSKHIVMSPVLQQMRIHILSIYIYSVYYIY